jgi:hypothetical protein
MVSECIPTILVKGNQINAGHNQGARFSYWTFFFDNLCPLKGSLKKPLHFEFQEALLGSSSMNNIWSSFP